MLQKLLRRTLIHYLAHLVIFGILFALTVWHPYYIRFLRTETHELLKILFVSYAVLGLPYYFLRFKYFIAKDSDYENDKLCILGRYCQSFLARKKKTIPKSLKSSAKTAALSYIVKFFFMPIMVNFFFDHWQHFLTAWRNSGSGQPFWQFFWDSGYYLVFNLIFIIDTLIFAFAYTFEFRLLKNKIKSVDPFLSGWVIALICYPPFNGTTDHFIPLVRDNAWLTEGLLLDVSKILILVFFAIYLWATIALGFKASNLTNRGIVSTGPYRFVRHPAYAAKNLAWWFELLPFLTAGTALALIIWNLIYILRAITEERHLSQDTDYLKYKKKVKWRLIPGLF